MTQIRPRTALLALVPLLLIAGFGLFVRADEPPIRRVELFNLPVSSNANVLTSSLTLNQNSAVRRSAAYRITVGLDATDGADSILELRVTSGSDSIDLDFNDGTTLTKGRVYTFTFGAGQSYSYNFQCETETVIGYLLVEEIQDGEL